MRISDWSSDVCSSDLCGRKASTGEASGQDWPDCAAKLGLSRVGPGGPRGDHGETTPRAGSDYNPIAGLPLPRPTDPEPAHSIAMPPTPPMALPPSPCINPLLTARGQPRPWLPALATTPPHPPPSPLRP